MPGCVDRSAGLRAVQKVMRRLDMLERHRAPAGGRSHRAPEHKAPERARRITFNFQLSTFYFLDHPRPVVSCKLSLSGEGVDHGWVKPRLEQRQQLGAHAIAWNREIGIGLVFHARDAALLQ